MVLAGLASSGCGGSQNEAKSADQPAKSGDADKSAAKLSASLDDLNNSLTKLQDPNLSTEERSKLLDQLDRQNAKVKEDAKNFAKDEKASAK
jgi:hypothetical protein